MYDAYTLVLGFTDDDGDYTEIVERVLYFDEDATLIELAERVNEVVAEETAKVADEPWELTNIDLYFGETEDDYSYENLEYIALE
jgi:hypothetical protein